jgi:hypothetical protein
MPLLNDLAINANRGRLSIDSGVPNRPMGIHEIIRPVHQLLLVTNSYCRSQATNVFHVHWKQIEPISYFGLILRNSNVLEQTTTPGKEA